MGQRTESITFSGTPAEIVLQDGKDINELNNLDSFQVMEIA